MNLNMSWGELAQAAGGSLALGKASDPVRSISTDTRKLAPGQAFWALTGERHDAHDFLDATLARAADGWVVRKGSKRPAAAPRHVVEVPDTQRALALLAAAHRKRFSLPVAAIAGSNGKTTTKEMLRAILSRLGPVCSNAGNLNNQIGLPLTVLELSKEHRFGVFELGASRAGDIAYLCRVAQPTVAVLTNIGRAHIEFFGSLEGTFRAKSELVDCIPEGAPVVLGLDDDWLPKLLPRLGKRAVTFGRAASASVRILDAAPGELALRLPDAEVRLRRPWAGHLHRLNAAAAAAAARALGLSAAQIAEGLEGFAPAALRFEPRRHPSGAWLVLDAYNANPDSMRAGIATFLETAAEVTGRLDAELYVVLGDMLELGKDTAAMHRELGLWLGTLPLAGAFLAGPAMVSAARGLAESGARFPVEHRERGLDLLAAIRPRLRERAALYFKASRGMRLEELAEKL